MAGTWNQHKSFFREKNQLPCRTPQWRSKGEEKGEVLCGTGKGRPIEGDLRRYHAGFWREDQVAVADKLF
jgi:hypothetical protein